MYGLASPSLSEYFISRTTVLEIRHSGQGVDSEYHYSQVFSAPNSTKVKHGYSIGLGLHHCHIEFAINKGGQGFCRA